MHAICSMKFLRDFNGYLSINFQKTLHFSSLFPKPHSFSSSPPPLPGGDLVSAAVTILKHHRSKSRWSHLRSLLTTTRNNHSLLTPSQFSQIALNLRNNPHLALRFFHFTLHHSLSSHSLSSYATVIHILSRSRFKVQALKVIKLAMFEFSDQNSALLEALIKTYRVCDSAPFVFDLLVKACLESKKIDRAIEIYEMLKSKNVFLRTSTCNSLIELVSKSRGCFAGYDLYREIFDLDVDNVGGNGRSGKGISVNANTFNVVMVGFYREGLVDKVEKVWEEMKMFDCVPNVYGYNVLMAAYCDDGRMEEAMRVLGEMKNNDLNVDATSYNTIIGGFCGVGDVMRAEEIYREMAMNGVETTGITFEHLINGYCKLGDVDSAMVLYKDMCRKSFSLESKAINVIVRSLCDVNGVSKAMEFWRMVMKKYEVVSEKESYEKLIKGLCMEGKLEEGLKLQGEMVRDGFEPGSEIYGVFIDGYTKQGNEIMASELRKEMLGKDMS
ncbi:hypothetical protein BUALT_Bualt19G0114200 [Buddleja alternifolia]|uniref:Pentatricopeptide repeat-containing protein n=1 Tax=Buddleja alternifolia TaxID=168488 RepID=A0AAV6WBK5_9LAMI|nr:hypothetical protein BUALT_Bualt19G0114200 [Buddleja alternifolia]